MKNKIKASVFINYTLSSIDFSTFIDFKDLKFSYQNEVLDKVISVAKEKCNAENIIIHNNKNGFNAYFSSKSDLEKLMKILSEMDIIIRFQIYKTSTFK